METIIHKVHSILNVIFKKITKKDLCKTTFKQFIKHYMVGVFGIVFNYSLFNLLMYGGFSIEISNAITYSVLLVVIFFLQKHFTYRVQHHSIWQPVLFFVQTVLYGVLDTLMLILMIESMKLSPLLAKLVSIMILAPLSFLCQKYIVFREQKK